MFYRLKGPFLVSYYAIFAYKLNTLMGLFTQLVSFLSITTYGRPYSSHIKATSLASNRVSI